jgi:hypothetical protein
MFHKREYPFCLHGRRAFWCDIGCQGAPAALVLASTVDGTMEDWAQCDPDASIIRHQVAEVKVEFSTTPLSLPVALRALDRSAYCLSHPLVLYSRSENASE